MKSALVIEQYIECKGIYYFGESDVHPIWGSSSYGVPRNSDFALKLMVSVNVIMVLYYISKSHLKVIFICSKIVKIS